MDSTVHPHLFNDFLVFGCLCHMLLGHLLVELFSELELLILCSVLLQHLNEEGGRRRERGRREGVRPTERNKKYRKKGWKKKEEGGVRESRDGATTAEKAVEREMTERKWRELRSFDWNGVREVSQ